MPREAPVRHLPPTLRDRENCPRSPGIFARLAYYPRKTQNTVRGRENTAVLKQRGWNKWRGEGLELGDPTGFVAPSFKRNLLYRPGSPVLATQLLASRKI